MQQSKFNILIFLLLIGVFVVVPVRTLETLSSYPIMEIRSQPHDSVCSGFSKDDIYKEKTLETEANAYISSFENMYWLSTKTLGKQTLINGNFDQIEEKTTADVSKVLSLIGFLLFYYGIFIALILLIIPCIVLPQYCPPARFRKQDLISKETKWVYAITIAAIVCLFCFLIVGLIRVNSLPSAVQKTSCAAEMIFDDYINGNYNEKHYFVGLRVLSQAVNQLGQIAASVNQTLNNMVTRSTKISAYNQQSNLTKYAVSVIPNGTLGQKATIEYPTPLGSAVSYYSNNSLYANYNLTPVFSTFPKVLGNDSDPYSLVGRPFYELYYAGREISDLAYNADLFVEGIDDFLANQSGIQANISTFISQIQAYDNIFLDRFQNAISSKLMKFRVMIPLFIGGSLICAIVMLFAIVTLVYCSKSFCRYVLFGFSGLFLLFGIIGLAITLLTSIEVPNAYVACKYLNQSFLSANNFTEAFNLTGIEPLQKFQACFEDGNIDLMQLIAPDLAVFNYLRYIVRGTSSFNNTPYIENITEHMEELRVGIDNYLYSKIDDLEDQAARGLLEKISNPGSYANCMNDSWIPSTKQIQSSYPCMVSGGSIDSSNCANPSSVSGCSGCMDTSDLFKGQVSISTTLTTRYPSCLTFTTELSNIWTNYYANKEKIMLGIQSRFNTAILEIDNLKSQMYFSPNIMHHEYGIVQGLKCSLIHDDMLKLAAFSCTEAYSKLEFERILIGAISFLICLVVFLGILSGHYYNRQANKLLYKEQNEDSSISESVHQTSYF